jgi:hypothetical protein
MGEAILGTPGCDGRVYSSGSTSRVADDPTLQSLMKSNEQIWSFEIYHLDDFELFRTRPNWRSLIASPEAANDYLRLSNSRAV